MARISRRLPMKHQGQTVSEITSICMARARMAVNSCRGGYRHEPVNYRHLGRRRGGKEFHGHHMAVIVDEVKPWLAPSPRRNRALGLQRDLTAFLGGDQAVDAK